MINHAKQIQNLNITKDLKKYLLINERAIKAINALSCYMHFSVTWWSVIYTSVPNCFRWNASNRIYMHIIIIIQLNNYRLTSVFHQCLDSNITHKYYYRDNNYIKPHWLSTVEKIMIEIIPFHTNSIVFITIIIVFALWFLLLYIITLDCTTTIQQTTTFIYVGTIHYSSIHHSITWFSPNASLDYCIVRKLWLHMRDYILHFSNTYVSNVLFFWCVSLPVY